ncbi:hypothetical protein SDC9_43577 [bioreactor metagenome]|uniref:Uncharacterized protein n=1 Tax=bioreactor metagenome TaxID=1076179 RepID=A0A644W1J4_9ZZZZ
MTRGLRITYGELTSFGCGFKDPFMARKIRVEKNADLYNSLPSTSALTSALISTFHYGTRDAEEGTRDVEEGTRDELLTE